MAATRRIGAEGDGEAAVGEVCLAVAGQRQRRGRMASFRRMQRQSGEASRSLIVRKAEVEVLWCDTPDCRIVTGVKAVDRAPDVGCGATIVHKEGVRPAATSEEFEPAPPSSTLVPLLTAMASVPAPEWMNQLGVLTLMFRLSWVTVMNSLWILATGPV